MKKIDEKTKQNLMSGGIGTAGAAVGVAVGSMAAGRAQAAEVNEPTVAEEEQPATSEGQAETGSAQQHGRTTSGASRHEPTPNPEPKPEPTPTPNPNPEPQPTPEPQHNNDDVEVISYESTENGDLAVVRVENETYFVLDADQDGNADYIAMDQNHDGQLQSEEIHDVQGQGISMKPFQTGASGGVKPEDNTNGGSGSNSGDDVEVVSYETVTKEDGGLMDVAVVSSDGQQVAIIDVDQNGMADYMAADMNQNGSLEENEIVDVSGSHIEMQPLQAAANQNTMQPDPITADDSGYMAQTDDVDYVNDANVDSFMA